MNRNWEASYFVNKVRTVAELEKLKDIAFDKFRIGEMTEPEIIHKEQMRAEENSALQELARKLK